MDEKRIEELAHGAECELHRNLCNGAQAQLRRVIRQAINEALDQAAADMCRPYEESGSELIQRATAQARIRAMKVPG